MTQTASAPAQSPPFSRRVHDAVAAYPDAVAVAVYALVVAGALVAAYFAMFDQFRPYDDEGTLLATLNAFVHGDSLYRDIWSPYGPFYYELFGGLFSATGQAVTTDASRSIVMVVWVSASLMFGIASHRLTGRLLLGVTGMIAAFATLYVLPNEPMHPQGLCALLLAAFLLLAVAEPRRGGVWQGLGCGFLLAALVMTKVNLGVFALAGVVIAAAWTLSWVRRRRWLLWAVTGLFLLLPLAVLARDLNLGWVRELLVIEVLAMAAILVASQPVGAVTAKGEPALRRFLLWGLAGLLASAVAMVVAIVLTGPGLADVYDGVVTQAVRIRDLLVLQFPFPPAAVDWAILALAAAVVVSRLRTMRVALPPLWSALLRGLAGLTILLTVGHVAPFGLSPSAGNPDLVAMMLAWVAAVPLAAAEETAHRRFLRVMLPALAVAETLQVYPVAGSQTGIAAISFVTVGALCLADSLAELRRWSLAGGPGLVARAGAVSGIAIAAVAGMFALNSIVLPAATNAVTYREQESLGLPGAALLHLPATEVAEYRELVGLLHQNHCTTFVGYPSTNSLYLWSGLEPPVGQIPNAWVKALDRSQQQRIVNELRSSKRPCAIRNNERAEMYVQGQELEDLPLIHYVFNDFRLKAKVGGFEFFVPTAEATG